ncbi:MAG: type II toxin-antitoxin system VapC family toxin [Burkholderiales bacterium]
MIVDTNALSAFIDGEEAIGKLLTTAPRVAIPVIVIGEFQYGIAASRHRLVYERWLEDHLREFEVLPVTRSTTFPYAALRIEIKRIGKPIPANDAWIAALCLEHAMPVVSRDEHFDAVPGVRRLAW